MVFLFWFNVSKPLSYSPSPLTERETKDNMIGMRNQDKRWHTNPDLWEKLKPIAREMRGKQTEAESLLWQHLRRHHLRGLSFRRQHSIGQFIVDFYCAKERLVIEVDGSLHQYQVDEDLIRQEFLKSLNLKMLRFTNDSILNSIDKVIKKIEFNLSSTD